MEKRHRGININKIANKTNDGNERLFAAGGKATATLQSISTSPFPPRIVPRLAIQLNTETCHSFPNGAMSWLKRKQTPALWNGQLNDRQRKTVACNQVRAPWTAVD